jgi:glucose/mannose-6-phosphate isomerase
MLDLDLPDTYETVDPTRIRDSIADVPRQMREAYAAARALKIGGPPIRSLSIAGMGDSAVGAEIALAAYAGAIAAPATVIRGYDLPAWARGAEHVVIAVSHSGNSEEVVACFEEALGRGCRVVALSNGGRISARAVELGLPLAACGPGGRFSATTGLAAMGVVGALTALGVLPDTGAEAEEACAMVEESNRMLGPAVPVMRSSCKRLAGQFMTRVPILLAAGHLAPVARWWKIQINSTAKMLALWEELPEFNHGAMMILDTLGAAWPNVMAVSLRAADEHPRLALRHTATATLMLEAGMNIDSVRARGQSKLAQAFSLVAYGDWCAYYTAVIAGIDPAIYGTVPAMDRLKDYLMQE